VCSAPGIRKHIKTNETPHKLRDDENSEKLVKANLKERFSKMFQYKKSKAKSIPSFTFPYLKAIEAQRNPNKQETNLIKSSRFSVPNSRQQNIKTLQYVPLPKASKKHDFSELVSTQGKTIL
jgi:hypothetical protein